MREGREGWKGGYAHAEEGTGGHTGVGEWGVGEFGEGGKRG